MISIEFDVCIPYILYLIMIIMKPAQTIILQTISMFQICSLLRGGIAERGGIRVGHRIIEINGQSVVSVPHEKIVNMLATAVGEVSTSLANTVRLFHSSLVNIGWLFHSSLVKIGWLFHSSLVRSSVNRLWHFL